jgi:transcriptional regulator with XRE-family HTH domain
VNVAVVSVQALQSVARARRRELGLSQQDVANAADVSRKWLSAFERGAASAAELPLVLRLLAALHLRLVVEAEPAEAADPEAGPPRDQAGEPAVDLDALLSRYRSDAQERGPA